MPHLHRCFALFAPLLLVWMSALAEAQTFDLVILNGHVVDGSGSPEFRADVAIRGDTIEVVGRLDSVSARRVIDATGRLVVPGFIDMHSHADRALSSNDRRSREVYNLVAQGITTVVFGPDDRNPIWPIEDEIAAYRRGGTALNVVPMVGHGTVRGEVMLPLADRLVALKREVEQRTTGLPIEPAAARHSILMLGGRVEGGSNFNLVPGECTFTVDRRLNPDEDLDTERRRLFDVLDQARDAGAGLDVEVIQEGRSSETSAEDPLARSLASNIEAVNGQPARFEMCPGLLEIRFYAERGIPALAYGSGLLSVSHGPNEFVKLDDVNRAAAVYALTVAELLRT
ncbi:MAG: M20/M25/M40 family metallo-hydrolase [Vicinamibacterales bacterium]|nr:hypothetical protein [Acidobacteriota bacterium]MDP7295159.1 M20/M25/M40 family metallo-hydrolase [Vicinamibacterales bacterium]MDP7472505.1 M20/M25/M40 family metallo-hydrolase [Vicinamibacterales bacterium]MDP7670524.1 M20/M25/M40 family metallo-hydrolase [Vicinamibacterales bacterium]HJO38181.1 M20/M25/M40 family metallo-hydrolase [Vicinamibacterales bacterium]